MSTGIRAIDLKAAETIGFSKSVGEADTAETLPSNELQPLNSIQAIGISKSQAHKIIAQGAKDTAISETHAKLVSSNCNGDYKIEVSDRSGINCIPAATSDFLDLQPPKRKCTLGAVARAHPGSRLCPLAPEALARKSGAASAIAQLRPRSSAGF